MRSIASQKKVLKVKRMWTIRVNSGKITRLLSECQLYYRSQTLFNLHKYMEKEGVSSYNHSRLCRIEKKFKISIWIGSKLEFFWLRDTNKCHVRKLKNYSQILKKAVHLDIYVQLQKRTKNFKQDDLKTNNYFRH